MKLRRSHIIAGLIMAASVAAGSPGSAGTQFLTYQGDDGIQKGQGGEAKVVDGVDFWVEGSPPRRFQILGTIEDERHKTGLIGMVAMSGLERDIAKKAREAGGDAVILSGSQDNVKGYVGSSSGSTFFAHPIESRSSRYVVVKYLSDEQPKAQTSPALNGDSLIPLERNGGVMVVPVIINGSIELKFIVDSGAADVSIPADVFSTLVRAGTIDATDYIGNVTFSLADGSTVPSARFRIRKLRIGGREIVNVEGNIANPKGPLLLGQSFPSHFKSWSIDNRRQVLILGGDQ